MIQNTPICDYEDSSWGSTFWPGREYEDQAERIALAHLLPKNGKRLVEIGAGFGRLADLYGGYERVVLLDYAHSMLQDARARLGNDPRFIFVTADLYNLPFADNALDTAVTVRVLHHVANIPRAFGEIARIVHPQGAYVTDFANKRHLKAIFKHWFGQMPDNPFSTTPYEFVNLNFDYHPNYIRNYLRQVGFEIRQARAVSTFRIRGLKQIFTPTLLARIDGLIQKPTARLQLSPSIFLQTESIKPGAAETTSEFWRCLRCNSTNVQEQVNGLACQNCVAFYPLVNGIYDLKDLTAIQ